MKTLSYPLFRVLFPVTILFFLCLPHLVKATSYPFSSTYTGSNEVPANSSTATGTISGTYDDATNTISYTISFSGLGSNTVAAHFHGPAFPGRNAPVAYGHAGFPTGVTSGSLPVTSQVITDAQEIDLLAGKWYSNIHTTNFPGGEIRALIFFGAPLVLPTLTCPADTTVSNAAGICSQSVSFAADTAGSAKAELIYRIDTTVIYAPYNFPVGTNTVTVMALNGAGFVTCTFDVTVNDTLPPVITCPADTTVFNDPGVCGAIVNFTPTALDNCSNVTITSVPESGSLFPVGTTTVTSTATDSSGNASSCTFTVTVIDNEPPVISNLGATPKLIWSPNHKMKNITVDYTSTDNCTVVSCVLSVSSNESQNGLGDGNTSSDWRVIDDHHVQLRSERSGRGTGRIYTIRVTCTDQYGNSASDSTTVTVPHRFAGLIHGNGGRMEVAVAPNPSNSHFILNVESEDNTEKIFMKVVDQWGRIVETRNNVTAHQPIMIGDNLKPGIYFVQLQQGSEITQIKLLKIK